MKTASEVLPADSIRRLRNLDCCAVSDALDRLGLKGVASGLIQQSGAGRIAGQVVTVLLDVGDPPPGPPRHLCVAAIEASGPDNVIVIEQRSGLEAGCWGGLLTLGAKVRGVAGVIADGPVRDIDEARANEFAVFTHSLTALTARGRIVEKATNVPICVRGVTVRANDYVIADRSGVAFIGAEDIERVLEAAEAVAAREAQMAKAIVAGTPLSRVLSGAYENMLRKP